MFLSSQVFSNQEMQELGKVFKELDKDHSGSLRKDEIKLGLQVLEKDMPEAEFEQLWLQLD